MELTNIQISLFVYLCRHSFIKNKAKYKFLIFNNFSIMKFPIIIISFTILVSIIGYTSSNNTEDKQNSNSNKNAKGSYLNQNDTQASNIMQNSIRTERSYPL